MPAGRAGGRRGGRPGRDAERATSRRGQLKIVLTLGGRAAHSRSDVNQITRSPYRFRYSANITLSTWIACFFASACQLVFCKPCHAAFVALFNCSRSYLSLDTWSHIVLTHISPHSIEPQCCNYLSHFCQRWCSQLSFIVGKRY